jgi:hypothetical protein
VIFGQTTPSPQSLWDFMVVVMFLAVLAERVFSLFDRSRKQKREVSFAEEFVTKPEFNELKSTVHKHEEYGKERREKIYEMIRQAQAHTDQKLDRMQAQFKGDVEGVHGRVSDLVETVGEIRGEIKQALKK